MATVNPFDLLGDYDMEDPLQLIATQQQKIEPKKALALSAMPAVAAAAKLPSKPLPPAQSDSSMSGMTMQEKIAKRQADIRSRQNANTSRSPNQPQQQPQQQELRPKTSHQGTTDIGNKRRKIKVVRREQTENVEFPQDDSVKVEILNADNTDNLDMANTELPPEPCLFRNTPWGVATNYFKQVICEQDQKIYAVGSAQQQMKTFHLLHMQSANVYEAFSNRYKDLETRYYKAVERAQKEAENAAFSKQTTDETLVRMSLMEQEMQQLWLTNADLRKECYTWESRYNNLLLQQSSTSTLAVKDFKHSQEGKDWVEGRALDWFSVGFTRCQAQYQESGLFSPDANQDFVDMERSMPNEFPMPEFNPED